MSRLRETPGKTTGFYFTATVPLGVVWSCAKCLNFSLFHNIWMCCWVLVLALPPSKYVSLFVATNCPRVGASFTNTSTLRGRNLSCSPTHKPTIFLKKATILPITTFHSRSKIYYHVTSILLYHWCCSKLFILLCLIK